MKKFLIINQKSFNDLGVVTQKDLWVKAKEQGYSGLSLDAKAEFKKSEDGNKYHAVFSSANMDRHLDIVFQNFDLTSFAKNPVYLDSHNYDSIERIIGRIENARVENGMLQGDVVLAIGSELGKLADYLISNNFLNANSIGFIPLEFDQNGNITKSELLEISAVSVPANPDALFNSKTIKAEGDECTMDDGSMGEMHPNGDGQMVCMPKAKKIKAVEPYQTPVAFKAAISLSQKNKSLLVTIANSLGEMRPSNKGEQQRKIFKTLREAFK